MSGTYNLDEIFSMAVCIEQNGRAFYAKMAQMYPDHNEFLTMLSKEKIAHEQTFMTYQKKLEHEGDTSYEDIDGVLNAYLFSITDSIIFKPIEELDELYGGGERIEQIIEDAISREQNAVTFFSGIRKALSKSTEIAGIDEIIEEEMTHIAWLVAKRQELQAEGIAKAEATVFDLIIVGAGPGGVSMAAEAIEAGMDSNKILLLEQAERNSWIIRKLYPDQKIVTANYKGIDPECKGIMKMRNMGKRDALQMLNSTMIDFNMQFLYDMKVQVVEKKDGLFYVSANDHVFKSKLCAIGIGVFGKPNKPSYKIPASIRKLVNYDVTSTKCTDCEVMVVGGGDSSAEYTMMLLKEGNRLILAARDSNLSHMNDINRSEIIDQAKKGNLSLLSPAEVSAIEDCNGRIKVDFANGTKSITVDRIVYALGGTTPMNFLQISGIEFSDGVPKMDEYYETNVKGLYLLGDLAAKKNRGAIVVAFNISSAIVARMKDTAGFFFSKN